MPQQFLRRHWQKRPLLVRRALAGVVGDASLAALAALAARDDVESRLVRRRGRRWPLAHGPFAPATLRRMPARNWTLLVQGFNYHSPGAEKLLRRFAFIPQARLDDVMASYAAPGGGVGPHWDSYDVFLVQVTGRRAWSICRPRPFRVLQGEALRIIDGFEPEDEYLLEPGDMLYLPPGWGHDGVALEPSVTLSVGFRAPGGAELCAAFLEHLIDRGLPDSAYRDPDLRPASKPAEIGSAMLAKTRAMLGRVRWTRADMDEFTGIWLSTPKPQVSFARRRRPLAPRAFALRRDASTVTLDPRTLMLYRGRRIYVNGEALDAARGARNALHALADRRSLSGKRLASPSTANLLYDWYLSGYLHLA